MTSPSPRLKPGTEDVGLGFLASGFLTDYTIICGSKTWNVHKAILCMRSPYFITLFSTECRENDENSVHFEGEEPTSLGWIISYMYSGNLNHLNDLLQDDDKFHHTCLELYRLADYFMMEALKAEVVAALRKHSAQKMTKVQTRFSASSKTQVLEQAYLENYFTAASAACDLPMPSCLPLRDAFIEFFSRNRFTLLRDERSWPMIEARPRLATQLLKLLVNEGSPRPGSD